MRENSDQIRTTKDLGWRSDVKAGVILGVAVWGIVALLTVLGNW